LTKKKHLTLFTSLNQYGAGILLSWLKKTIRVFSPLYDDLKLCAGILDHGDDLIVPQLEDLLSVDAPHVVPLLAACIL
jgi:hypothetical protein